MNISHVYATCYRNVEIRDTCRPVSPLFVLPRESLTRGSINLSVRRAYVTTDDRQGIRHSPVFCLANHEIGPEIVLAAVDLHEACSQYCTLVI
jgi:hypothetical protein